MPPAFAYAMCLMLYIMGMGVGLAVCLALLLFPSMRRTAIRLAAAIVASLPGVLFFQLVVAIPLGILLALVFGFDALFHTPDSVQWVIGIPIIIMFLKLLAASLLGCYTGGHIAWRLTGFSPFRIVIAEEPVFRFISRWIRRRKA
jgi:hypothetical protein